MSRVPPFRWDLVTPDQLGSLLDGVEEPDLTRVEVGRVRELLADIGVTPAALARQPVTFVDVVSAGGTFGELFQLLDEWIDETREPWDVVRRQLRFVGVTIRRKTSPNTWRWQQHASWTTRLPARGKDGRRAIARATGAS
jgi:hypothetical protein